MLMLLSQVEAVDISAHMAPEEVPPNLLLQVDDLNGEYDKIPSKQVERCPLTSESRFTFPHNMFDLVHSQLMAAGIHANRWERYMADILRVLRPGGWCQMVEIYFNAQSDNGSLTDGE